MLCSRKGFRLLAGSLAAGLSLAAGFVLVFRLATPATAAGLPTVDLLGLVGLLVLPPLAAWAFAFDRRTARRLAAVPEPGAEPAPAEPAPAARPASTLEAKPADFGRREAVPGRTLLDRHRRRQPEPAKREHAPSRR
jgi:hypothetical protein